MNDENHITEKTSASSLFILDSVLSIKDTDVYYHKTELPDSVSWHSRTFWSLITEGDILSVPIGI